MASLSPHGIGSLDALDVLAPDLPGARSTRWIALLLALVVCFMIALELVTAYGLTRVSKIQGRVREEYLAARTLRQTHSLGHIQVLMAGNSLLLDGVDLPKLEAELQPAIQVKRFAVEGTEYFDWYYGLKRLFHEGARPDAVVLTLTARHLASSEVLGEYFAHYLMRTGDVISVARDLRLNLTGASNLLFGNMSAFYGARAEIRNWLFNRTVPGLNALMEMLAVGKPAPLSRAELGSISGRLAALKRLAAENGARLVLLSPPTMREDYTDALAAAGRAAGVPVIAVARDGTLLPSDFRADGFHLNESGAAKHTAALTPALEATIGNLYRETTTRKQEEN
jgi:hypothetical protein